ncbi:MAG: alkylation response protein AidB-like acyl-CoA dehydrogenase, partial [Bacteroidia bacterium]
MNFSHSESQIMVRQAAKDFAEKYIRPYVMEWDESQHFPVEVFR